MSVNSRVQQEKFEPILPGPDDWPVVQLSRQRKEFVQEVSQTSFDIIKKNNRNTTELIEELEGALYREKLRMRAKPWKVDPEDEKAFWDNIKTQLASLSGSDNQLAVADEILRSITDRYAEEIAGNFKPSSYKFARGIATFGFARLLNATRKNKITGLFKKHSHIKGQD